jgi:ribose 1,5-bisphosphokinase
MPSPSRGTLFLVVGPSGAGKDTLIDGARAALTGESRYVFPRRVVTRPAAAGGEQHEAATSEIFANLRRSGAFALAWSAHGHDYGIRRSIEDELAAGRHVVVNVSRAALDEARRRFQPAVVVEVTAQPSILAQRLAARGREDAAAIAERLDRAAALTVGGKDVVRIDNSGTIAEGVAAFVAALRAATRSGPAQA